MHDIYQGTMPAEPHAGANILMFPTAAARLTDAAAPAGEQQIADRNGEVRKHRLRIPGVALGLLVLPATMLLMELLRRLFEGG
jgi:hypothetical protein